MNPINSKGLNRGRILLGPFLFFLLFLPFATTMALPLLSIEPPMHTASIRKFALHTEKPLLATASIDKTVRVWSARDLSPLATLRFPRHGVNGGMVMSVAFSPDGQYLACGHWSGEEDRQSITVYDWKRNHVVWVIDDLPNVAYHLEYSRDGRFLIAGLGWGGGIRLYETQSYRKISAHYGLMDSILWISLDPVRDQLVASTTGGQLALFSWDHEGEIQLLHRIDTGAWEIPYTVAYHPRGDRIAIGYTNGPRLEIRSAQDLSLLYMPVLQHTPMDLHAIAWSPDGQRLFATGQKDRNLHTPLIAWDRQGRGTPSMWELPTYMLGDIGFLEEDHLLFTSLEPGLGWFQPSSGKVEILPKDRISFHEHDTPLFVSEDGMQVRFFISSDEREAIVFDARERVLWQGMEAMSQEVRFFLPITTPIYGIEVTNWLLSTQPRFQGRSIALEANEISRALAIHPMGKGFALGTEWYLRFYNSEGAEQWKRPAPSPTEALTLARGGDLVVAGFSDGSIRWFRSADGAELAALYLHPSSKGWVFWSPSGYYALHGDVDEWLGWFSNPLSQTDLPRWDPLSRYYEAFFHPGIPTYVLMELMTDQELFQKKGEKPITILDFPPPPELQVRVKDWDISEENAWVDLTVCLDFEEAEVLEIWAQLNGRTLVKEAALQELSLRIPMVDLENQLVIRAMGAQGVLSSPWSMTFEQEERRRSNLYVLAIGVDESIPASPLRYAAKDAEMITQQLLKGSQWLYDRRIVYTLTNEQASLQKIEDLWERMVAEIQPHDPFLLIFAGHGMYQREDPSKEGVYGLLLHEGEILDLPHLMDLLMVLPSYRVSLWIDACQSGTLVDLVALAALEKNFHHAHRLEGVSILSASYGMESAWEFSALGHGIFSYCILEAFSLSQETVSLFHVADHLFQHLPKLYLELTGRPQFPKTFLHNWDLPLVSNQHR